MRTDTGRIKSLIIEHKGVFREGFLGWWEINMHVFTRFCELADRLWERGRRHYSARTIGEVMRFETDVSENFSQFKLNNNRTSDMGRLYVLIRPERVDLFEYRRDAFKAYVRMETENADS